MPDPKLQQVIQEAAKTYGVDPAFLYRLLAYESSNFDPSVLDGSKLGSSGELGIAQIMPATLKGLGYTPADATNPVKAVAIAAEYLGKLGKKYGNNPELMAAAYNAGEPRVDSIVSQMAGKAISGEGGSWKDLLPASTRDVYLPNVTGTVTPDTFAKTISPTSGLAGSHPGGAATPDNVKDNPPKLADFLNDPIYTNPSAARDAYYKAFDNWQLQVMGGSQVSLYDTYLKNIISEMGNQIAQGNLDINAASKRFTDLMETAKFGQDNYNTQAFREGAPVGATSIHGPLHDIPIEGGVTLNPMQEALSMRSQIPDYMALAGANRPNFSDINTKIQGAMNRLPAFAPPAPQGVAQLNNWMQQATEQWRNGINSQMNMVPQPATPAGEYPVPSQPLVPMPSGYGEAGQLPIPYGANGQPQSGPLPKRPNQLIVGVQ